MTKRTDGDSTSGKPIDEHGIKELSEQAEAGHDVDELITHRSQRDRPEPGADLPAEVAALEADEEDRYEMLAVADLMESSRAPQ